MKLGNIFAAREALKRLAALRMPSKIAYRVLKFSRKFDVEFGVIEEQRQKLIREVTGVEEGKEAKIEPGTPEIAQFFEKFGPIIETDSDLEPCPLKFDALMDALDSEEGNVLSAQDLAVLEPLFESDEDKPDLKIVD